MCKQTGNSHCTVLGEDPEKWDKYAPLSRPNWYDKAWQTLIKVLEFESFGEIAKARTTLSVQESDDLREWFHVHAQNSGVWRMKTFQVSTHTTISELDPKKTFNDLLLEILERDNFRCRYCSWTVLPESRLRRLQKRLGNDYFAIGSTNSKRSGYYFASRASLDHVVPHSLGGRTTVENLVTVCMGCNYGKAGYTLKQIGIEDPFARQPLPLEFPLKFLIGQTGS